MSTKVNPDSAVPYSNFDVFKELTKTDYKILAFVKASKVIMLTGLVITAFLFSPFFCLTMYSTYKFSLILGTGLLFSAALTINSLFLVMNMQKKRAIQKYIENNPQRIIEAMPLGLKNEGCNCWANSMIQFMMNIDSIKNKIYNLGFFNRLYGLKSLLSRYQTEEKDLDVRLSSIDSQRFRRLISSKSESISSDSSIQEDPHEAFTVLSDILPKTSFKVSFTYSRKDLPEPETFEGKDGQKLYLKDDSSFVSTREESFDFISLPIFQNGIFTPSLPSLIESFLNNSDVSDHYTEFDGIDGSLNRYKASSEQLRFTSAPDDLFFSLKRFGCRKIAHFSEEAGKMEHSFESWKNGARVEVPFVLQLKKDKHIVTNDASYELDAFIIHEGEGLKSGHYISCVKNNNIWFECNDSVVSVLSEDRAMDLASSAYLVHYKKMVCLHDL